MNNPGLLLENGYVLSGAQWFLLVGALLLFMGLTSATLKRLPITSAIIYLAVGLLVGPTVFNVFHFNPLKQSALLQVLTEVAVLISLFSAGVKMPVPFSFTRWRTPILLATVSMAITLGLIAVFACYFLDLPLGAGVLLGAILAPTGPVLATDVQIRHPDDRDQLRFTLTCEAGERRQRFSVRDAWHGPAELVRSGWIRTAVGTARRALGYCGWCRDRLASGAALAHLSWKLRGRSPRNELIYDFLGLGLIGVVYGLSVIAHAWGFLAVFFAAVALRQTELKFANAKVQPAPISTAPILALEVENGTPPTVSEGSLIFKEHLERLSEVVLVLLVGGMLFIDSWSWRSVTLALFVFLVARPTSVLVGLSSTRMAWRMRGMVAWFGVRGIGSLYYLMYAIQHGVPENIALELIQLTLIVVALSILTHGISVKPLMHQFWRTRKKLPD